MDETHLFRTRMEMLVADRLSGCFGSVIQRALEFILLNRIVINYADHYFRSIRPDDLRNIRYSLLDFLILVFPALFDTQFFRLGWCDSNRIKMLGVSRSCQLLNFCRALSDLERVHLSYFSERLRFFGEFDATFSVFEAAGSIRIDGLGGAGTFSGHEAAAVTHDFIIFENGGFLGQVRGHQGAPNQLFLFKNHM